MSQFFIAGTDTDIGKTKVSTLLLSAISKQKKRGLGLKPVAAGGELNADGELHNEDALALIEASSVVLPYSEVNPLCLPEPLSPHIAAKHANQVIQFDRLITSCQKSLAISTDVTLVEGAGGWRVPLNLAGPEPLTMAHLACKLGLPVIMVVGMRLGCLSHALLSVEAIKADGLSLHGWIANCIDVDMAAQAENIETLQAMINEPLLATIPHLSLCSEAEVVAKLANSPEVLGLSVG